MSTTTTNTNNTNNIKQTDDSSDASAAKILMKAGGETCKITGFALSSTATLYSMKYLSSFGTGLIEYIPKIFEKGPGNFRENVVNKNNISLWAVFGTVSILVGGIVIRKIGNTLSKESTINKMEHFLYKK